MAVRVLSEETGLKGLWRAASVLYDQTLPIPLLQNEP